MNSHPYHVLFFSQRSNFRIHVVLICLMYFKKYTCHPCKHLFVLSTMVFPGEVRSSHVWHVLCYWTPLSSASMITWSTVMISICLGKLSSGQKATIWGICSLEMPLISLLSIFYACICIYKYCNMLVPYVFFCPVSRYKNSSTCIFPGIFTTNQKDRYSNSTTMLPLLRFLSHNSSCDFEYTLFTINISSKTLSTCALVSYFTSYALPVSFSVLCSVPRSFTLTEELRSLSACQVGTALCPHHHAAF